MAAITRHTGVFLLTAALLYGCGSADEIALTRGADGRLGLAPAPKHSRPILVMDPALQAEPQAAHCTAGAPDPAAVSCR